MPHWPLQTVPGLHFDIFRFEIFGSSLDLTSTVTGRLALGHFITFLGISDCKIPGAVNKVKPRLLRFSFFPVWSPWTQPAFSSS